MKYIGTHPKKPSWKIAYGMGHYHTGYYAKQVSKNPKSLSHHISESYPDRHDDILAEHDVPIMEGTLSDLKYETGYNSGWYSLLGCDGNRYRVTGSDLVDFIPYFINGEVTDTFTFKKNGSNVSLIIYKEK